MQQIAPATANIPPPSTSLVGRATELAAILAMLARPELRLLTLTGPGGVGKTRLALQVAHEIDRDLSGDVHVALLANAPDAPSVLAVIARSLEVGQTASVPLDQRIAETIGDRRMLLILDNAEQVVEHLTMLPEILNACPNLTILVTSRIMLRLSAEHVFPVEPLTFSQSTADNLSPASALFVERAHAVRPDLPLEPDDIRAIDEICQQVDGLPLAIELAAARTRFLSPTALRDRLSARLPLLVGGPRDAPERHQTLRATLTWSHELLNTREQTLFRRLAIFENGAPYDAIEPICNTSGDLGASAEETLAALVDHSLVRITDRPATGPRVRLLNTIREFAQELLDHSGEHDTIAAAHAGWFSTLVISQPDENWRTGSEQLRDWTMRHEQDTGNFRLALTWLMAQEEKVDAIRLVSGLVPLWIELGVMREGRAWTQRVLPFAQETPLHTQSRLHYMAGVLAIYGDVLDDAERHGEAALNLARQVGNSRMVANCLNLLGTICWQLERPVDGERMQREAIEIIRDTGDDLGGTMYLANLGEHLLEHGDIEHAEALLREGMPVIGQHRPDALPLFQGSLAHLVLQRGNLDEAGELLEASLAYHREPPHRQPYALAERLDDAAWLAVSRGMAEQAARLLGAAGQLIERTGLDHHRIITRGRERAWAYVRREMDGDTFERELAAGRVMAIPDMITLALEIARMRSESPSPQREQPGGDHGLTDRQLDVLRLLAEGKSNAAIADALFISQRTVTTHLSHIYDRLDVSTRAEAISVANRLGLVDTDHT